MLHSLVTQPATTRPTVLMRFIATHWAPKNTATGNGALLNNNAPCDSLIPEP
jgi:hypothetical protein